MTPLLKSCVFSLRLNGCTGTKFVLILYYRSQRFHVNFDVKKVLVCRLSIGLYFSKSKFDLFFFGFKTQISSQKDFALVRFFALLVTHRPANMQIIFTFTTPETIEKKQRQGNKRKTKGELINTNEPFCVCVDAHPRFFYACLHVLRMRVFCVYFGSLISELHCK